LIAGSQYVLHIRVNLHGSNDFTLAFSSADQSEGTSAWSSFTNILTDLTYSITATGTDYNGFEIAFTVPDVSCTDCTMQIKGMGPPEWYNCAKVTIQSAAEGCGTDNCIMGKCGSKGCACQSGYGGTMCNTAVTNNGDVVLQMDLLVTPKTFDKSGFITALATQSGVDKKDISVSDSKSTAGEEYTTVVITFKSKAATDNVDAATIVSTAVTNKKTVGGYSASDSSNISHSKNKKGSSYNPGAAAAGIIVMLLVIGGLVGGYVYLKKHPEKAPSFLAGHFGGSANTA